MEPFCKAGLVTYLYPELLFLPRPRLRPRLVAKARAAERGAAKGAMDG